MFGGSWGQQNQQQQQQQQPQQNQQQPGTSAFGQQQQQQPNAFGSGATGGFGGGAFGQNTQQPTVNPMFGSSTSNPSSTGAAFGSFGGGGTSAFGAPKPPAFGAFGGGGTSGTSAFGSGGTFGQTNPSGTSAFGQPAGGTSAFGGTGTGLFGQKPAAPTTGFGSTSTGPTITTTDGSVPPVTTGSANPPYSVFSEKDANTPNITLNYQSISAMPAYRGTSFEEIRVQDYAQGRKTAGSFGQSATFGLAPSQSTSTTFGQPAANTSTFGAFGQNSQQSSTQPSTTFGSFGQPATTQPPAFGTGTSTGAFGSFGQNTQQPQQQQQPSGTGLFGGGSAFGQSNQQQQQQTGSAFGAFGQSNQPKPFGAFGQTSGTTGFGSGGGGGGLFGQSTNQPAGQPTTGLFGQPANQNQGTSAFGSFGANANKPAFGQPAAQQPASTGFSLFGQNNQQQQQQQQNQPQGQQPSTGLFGSGTTGTGTGLFGQNNQQQQGQQGQQGGTQPSTGLFGQPAPQTSTGLFGTGTTGTGLFGNNNQNKPTGFGLFGGTNNQAAGSGTTQPSTGLFGQPFGQSTTQPAPGTTAFGGSSLFGQKPPATNAFVQSTAQPASTGLGNSLFGASALGGTGGGFGQSAVGTGGVQGSLTASIAQPVQENLPIFSLLNNKEQPASFAPPPKKMSNFFADIPTRTPLGISNARLTNGGKLRGFGASLSAAGLNRYGGLQSSLASSKNASNLALSRGDSRSLLGADAFTSGPSLGSDGRSSPKKLVLHKKIDPSDVFGRSRSASASSKVEFNPAISIASREKEASSMPPPPLPTAPPQQRKSSSAEKDASELQDGDYYVKPPLDVLRKLSNQELSSFEGLVVGRKGHGEIQFLQPVDLTTLPKLQDLLGKIIEMDKQELTVYPESTLVEIEKPRVGEGLNVRTRVTLHGCLPRDKATGEPIKDPKHPAFIKQKRRLQIMKRTQFESFDPETGTWVFIVDHF